MTLARLRLYTPAESTSQALSTPTDTQHGTFVDPLHLPEDFLMTYAGSRRERERFWAYMAASALAIKSCRVIPSIVCRATMPMLMD